MVKGAGKICRRSKTVDAEIASAHGAPIMAPRGRISISLPCPTGWTAADNADYVNFRSSSPLRRRKVGPRFLGRKPASTPKVPKAVLGAVSSFGQREQRGAARVSDGKVTPERRQCGERGGERLIEGQAGIPGAGPRSSDWGPPRSTSRAA